MTSPTPLRRHARPEPVLAGGVGGALRSRKMTYPAHEQADAIREELEGLSDEFHATKASLRKKLRELEPVVNNERFQMYVLARLERIEKLVSEL